MSLQNLPDSERPSTYRYDPPGDLLDDQAYICQLILQGTAQETIIDTIAAWIEKQSQGKLLIAVHLTDNFGQYIVNTIAPSFPDTFGKQMGGSTWETATAAAAIEETSRQAFQQHPWWQPVAAVLYEAGIESAAARLIRAIDNQPLGVLNTFYKTKTSRPEYEQAITLAINLLQLSLAHARQATINKQLIEREKIAREEVNRAEKMAQLALQGAGAGTFNVNLADNYIEYSPLLSKILTGQYTPGLSRNKLVDNIHPDDRHIRDKAYQEADTTGRLQYEARFIWQDGSIHWVKAIGTYLPNAAGKPSHFAGIVFDITGEVKARDEQQRLLALIEDSEIRFRSMIERAPIAMGVFKGDRLIVEVANEQLLGLWSKDISVIGLPFEEALPEIKDQPFPALMREVIKSGKAHYGHETLTRLYRNDRIEDCYFNFVYAPFREGNTVTGVQVVASEVTAQVHVKKALEASEERFRNFIHSAPVPIAIYIGREMRIQIANETVLATWNRDASVIGRTFLEALPELEPTPWLEKLQNVYDTGIPFTATEERVDLLHHGRLEMFYFNFNYKPLYDGEGKIYGVINTAADVTSLVLARQQLLQTQGQLQSAIESAEMSAWRIDLLTSTAYYSPRQRHWFGFASDEINVQTGIQAIHPGDRARVMQHLEKLLAGNDNDYSDEYRVQNQQNKNEYIIRVTAKVHRDENGKPYELTGVAQDVTEQRLLEQKLEQLVQQRTEELSHANQHLKRSNEELEQFAYVASHDLQEPLRKIRIFSGMLMKQLQQEPGQQNSSQLLEKVIASAERMSQLIMDLLNYSHITKKEEQFQHVDLNKVLHQVNEDFELLIHQKQATLQINPLPVIEAIPLQMNQLFYNLVGNALKFTHPGRMPEITIDARSATQEEITQHAGLSGKDYWIITVKDNGIGFEPDMSKLIFTIFQRLHPKNKFEGTGIGLALCKRIIITHGGTIEASSTPGTGATFSILMPARQL